MARKKSSGIPAGSPAEEDRQPEPAETPASAPAGSPSGAGPDGTAQEAGPKADAVASASEPASTDAPRESDAQGEPSFAYLGTTPGEFEKIYPLLAAKVRAFLDAHAGEEDFVPIGVVRISSKRDGFRRAGMAHSKEPTDHPADAFTPERLEQLLGEPNLIVDLV